MSIVMKKILYYFGIIISLIIFIASIYVFFNIYFVFSTQNGQMYDGFGTPYSYDKPSSPYTIFGIAGIAISSSLFSFCKNKLNNKNYNI